jgi:glycerophosphoryl diester phosphodiesterase
VEKTRNIAHRGGAGLRPENTLAAFSAAIASGYDGAELDVQLSTDGVVVVHHDFRLNPALTRHAGGWVTGSTPLIKDLAYAALQAYDIGRADPASDYARRHPKMVPAEGEHIPTLEAVREKAQAARSPFLLFVELKTSQSPESGDPIQLADEVLAVMQSYLAGTVFVGFDWRGLKHIQDHAPGAHCWYTTDELEGDLKPILDGIRDAKAEGWFAHHRNVTAENAAHARALGLKVGAWTVNEPGDMKRLLALELDAICTDRPDLLADIRTAAARRELT